MKQGMRVAWTLGLVLLAACQHPKQSSNAKGDVEEVSSAGPVIKPWTDAFNKESLLFADEIIVDGPEGIIDRTALAVDPENDEVITRTTKDGLLQELRLKPGAAGELQAAIDNWKLVGFVRITILERVAPCDVHVRARGDVRFIDVATKAERAGASLDFEGRIQR
jgi:hypothetical protein